MEIEKELNSQCNISYKVLDNGLYDYYIIVPYEELFNGYTLESGRGFLYRTEGRDDVIVIITITGFYIKNVKDEYTEDEKKYIVINFLGEPPMSQDKFKNYKISEKEKGFDIKSQEDIEVKSNNS